MRIIFIAFLLVISSTMHSQKRVHALVDYTRTEFHDKALGGITFGLELDSKWQLSMGWQHGTGIADNLPNDFTGEKPIASMQSVNLNLGRKFYVFDTDRAWITTKIGVHRARYKDFTDYQIVAPPELNDTNCIDVIDPFCSIFAAISYQNALNNYVSHTYETVLEERLGLNGQLLLDTSISERITLGLGSNFMMNKRTKNVSFILKAGLRL